MVLYIYFFAANFVSFEMTMTKEGKNFLSLCVSDSPLNFTGIVPSVHVSSSLPL
jgi:hypothetical protein